MPEIHMVIVQINRPQFEGKEQVDPGRVSYGFYTIADGLMTMTDSDGSPMRDIKTGEVFTHRLRDGEDAEPVARALTKKIRRMLVGDNSAFNKPLNYAKAGVA